MKRLVLPSTLWLCLVALFMVGQSAQAQTLPDFTVLVEEAAPGVVNISTTRTVQRSSSPSIQGFGGQDIPEIFRHFFGDSFPAPPSGGQGVARSGNLWVRDSSSVKMAM